MAFVSVLLAVLVMIASGEGLLLLLRVRGAEEKPLDRLLATFGVGVAVVSTWSFLLAAFSVPLSAPLVAAPLLLYIVGRFRERGGASYLVLPRRPVRDRLGALTGLVVIAQIAYVFRHALIRPVHGWDAWRIWSFRAKAIFLERGFPSDFFAFDWAGFPGYPLGVPLVEAFLARAVGYWHEPAVKILFPLFFAGIAGLLWRFLRDRAPIGAARAGVLLFVTAPFAVYHGTVAYMDLPLAFFLFAAATRAQAWRESGDRNDLVLAALAAGFLPVVKNEGLPFYLLLTLLVLAGAMKRPSFMGNAARWFAASLPFCLPWLLFKYAGGIPESPYHTLDLVGGAAIAGRVGDYVRLLAINVALCGSWGVAWFPLLFLALPGRRAVSGTILATLAGGVLLFGAAYAFTGSDEFLRNGTALGRNLLILLPLAITAGVMALFAAAGAPGKDGPIS